MSLFDTLKRVRINSRVHKIVFGYIHNAESQLLNSVLRIDHMPFEIINLCLLYYWLQESFDGEIHAEDVQVSQNEVTVQLADSIDEWRSVYGTVIIDKSTYAHCVLQWTVTIHKNPSTVFEIGIVAMGESEANIALTNNSILSCITKCRCYGLYGNNHDTSKSNGCVILDAHHGFNGSKMDCNKPQIVVNSDTDNIIQMVLDIDANTLKYFINGNDFDLAFDDIDLSPKYKFTASLYNTNASMELTDFEVNRHTSR